MKFISLVNLVTGREVVRELVADGMTLENVRRELDTILPGRKGREAMLEGYEEMAAKLGETGAPGKAAEQIIALLASRKR